MPTSVSDATLNIRLPKELNNQLSIFAKSTGRTKSFYAVEALTEYLDLQSWQIAEIQKGIDQADRGEFATHDEMSSLFAKYAN